MSNTKCQAVSREKKPCKFNGSTNVGQLWLCGNHATQAKNGQNKEPIIKPRDLSNTVAYAIHKLYESDLGHPEVVASILRNAWKG